MTEPSDIDVTDLSLEELREECRKLSLKVSGNKAELRERLQGALQQKKRPRTSAPAPSEHSEDEDVQDEDAQEEDAEEKTPERTKPTMISQPLSFKDVEDSLQTFSGDGKQNIRKWLKDFKETSEVCLWSEPRKIIYAKKLLRGAAKLFVSYENCSKTWKQLEDALVSEFSKVTDSRQVHRELAKTRKKHDESYHEYVYRMMEIASHADIETEAKIQYIIDGIQDEPVNKSILYGATSIQELRKKLIQYEAMKNAANQKLKTQTAKPTKDTTKQTTKDSTKGSRNQEAKARDEKRCYNCGEKNHLSSSCPLKEKGTKCFNCGEFGHIASNCSKKSQSRKVNECNIVSKRDNKVYKTLEINNKELTALLDTGSDLHLMKAELYVKLALPHLTGPSITCRGLGTENVKTLGSFNVDVRIDEDVFNLVIHVISDIYMNHDLLLGSDLLRVATINLSGNNTMISKNKIESNKDSVISESLNVPEIFRIDVSEPANVVNERRSCNIEMANIASSTVRHELEETIANYQPRGNKQVSISLSLVLKDEIPVYERARRLAPAERSQVNAIIQDWLREGIIRSSASEYASPIVLAKKKDGASRLCVDYRKLNRKVVKDRYPLPLIEDCLDRLQGSKYFSTIDLKNGFFHVPVEESSRKYTAFVVPDGHYEFLRVPFGLCNSPAIFQKYITAVFRELMVEGIVLTYLDDLIVPSRTEEEGLERLRRVLVTASDYGLNVRWKKCHFLQSQVEYLGHIVENGCVKPLKRKTLAVKQFPVPTNVKQVQSFLGLTGYFRKFIPRYSLIARPLSQLLKDGVKFQFDDEQKFAFNQLKDILSKDPVLKLYRASAETELHTDASSRGYGAILFQKDAEDRMFHPVYFASWKTSEAESRYTSYELEVLAIIKALTKFRVYLLGINFKIVTDCQAFTMTMNKRDLCVRVARWALLLEEFNYTIEHRPGKSMCHVDALSRNPCVLAICESDDSVTMRLAKAQRDDEYLKPIFEALKYGSYSDFVLRNGVLYKQHDDDVLIVVPKAMQREIIKQAHDKGHFAVRKVEQLLKKEFWFDHVREKTEKVIRNCVPCILSERKSGKQEGWLHNIPKGDSPLETYHIDHLGPMTNTKKGYAYLFVVIDAFSKFAWLYPTKSTTSDEVIARLTKQAAVFGNPRQIVSDRGTAFTSHVFRQYCKEQRIQHVLCTTGVPRGNGQVERLNRVVIPVLSKLSAPKVENWYKHVDPVQQYLNSSQNRSTGFSPFELLVGKNMRLKDDLVLRELIEAEHRMQIQESRNQLRERASEAIDQIQRENQKVYNHKRKKPNVHEIGDLIAIRRTQNVPGSKLFAKYFGPYEVKKRMGNDRYEVRKVGEHEGPRVTTTSADNIKRWIMCESDVSERDTSVSDSDETAEEHQGLMSRQKGRVVGPRSPVVTRSRAKALAMSRRERPSVETDANVGE